MQHHHADMDIVDRVSDLAARTSERWMPTPLRGVMDRTLVDMACVAGGGRAPVASDLCVDIPAIHAWRRSGVPTEFRSRLTSIAMRPGVRRRPAAA